MIITKKEYLIGIVVVLLGVGAFVIAKKPEPAPTEQLKTSTKKTEEIPKTTNPVEKVEESTETKKEDATNEIQVTYTDSGFSPQELTVKVGDTVVFINKSSKEMWVASAVHPAHQILPEFDQLTGVGTSGKYEFTFDKIGTWTYHNHLEPSHIGTIIAE